MSSAVNQEENNLLENHRRNLRLKNEKLHVYIKGRVDVWRSVGEYYMSDMVIFAEWVLFDRNLCVYVCTYVYMCVCVMEKQ